MGKNGEKRENVPQRLSYGKVAVAGARGKGYDAPVKSCRLLDANDLLSDRLRFSSTPCHRSQNVITIVTWLTHANSKLLNSKVYFSKV